MNKKDLLEVTLKMIGVYFFTVAFDSFISIINSTTYFIAPVAGDKAKGLIFLLSGIIKVSFYLGGAWLLTTKIDIILSKFSIKNLDIKFSSSYRITELNRILFQAIGIIILFFSINELLSGIFYSQLFGDFNSIKAVSYKYYLLFLIPPILKLILGIFLLFTPNFIIKVLQKHKKNKPVNQNDKHDSGIIDI